MNDLRCVIKTLKDEDDKIVWEALYINGKKQLEDVVLNKEAANKLFNKNKEYKNVIIKESMIDEDNLEEFFPNQHDFTDLLDYTNVSVGDKIYLLDNVHEIESISKEYRTSDYYDLYIWTNIDGKYFYNMDKTFYSGHEAEKLKLKGCDKEIFWEDYNYQQSFLYLTLKQNGII